MANRNEAKIRSSHLFLGLKKIGSMPKRTVAKILRDSEGR
jgi:hypothetical protein